MFSLDKRITTCYENRFKGVKLYKGDKYIFIDSIYEKINFKLLESDGVILCEKPNGKLDIVNKDFEFVYSDFDLNNFSNEQFFKDEYSKSRFSISLIIKLLNKNKSIYYVLNSESGRCI